MAIEFCPLAHDVGNLAEWFGVGVGAVAAVATTVVAFLAYKTSARAVGIAEEAKGIAQQQHQEAVESRDATARIVVRLLMHEISELPVQLGIQIQRCDRTVPADSEGELRTRDVDSFARALQSCSGTFLPGTEQVLDRIHTLPPNLGDGLAILVGFNRTLSQMSKDLSQMLVAGPVRRSGVGRGFVYQGNERDMVNFRVYLASFLSHAIDLACAFRENGEMDAHDYSQFAALIDQH